MFEVYVHVPFCLRRCGYCDFNTYTAVNFGGGVSWNSYASMAIREMELVKAWQSDHGLSEPPASSVFFGGGTPTILEAGDLAAMLEAINGLWGIAADAEITTEANPDTIDQSYVNQLASAGFNRLSLGMQSTVPHVLRTLDRTHTPANVAAGLAAADKAGLRTSVDLIYGTPGESLDDWRQSVQTAIDYGVNHISAYALSIEPHTKMGRGIAAGTLAKPNDDDESDKYELADRMFDQAGLHWYEISNWSRLGQESKHNLGYWNNVDWVGIGPGAHSHYSQVSLAEKSVQPGGHGDAMSDLHSDCGRSSRKGFRKTARVDAVMDKLAVQPVAVTTPFERIDSEIRCWDMTHPKLWGQAIGRGALPWQGEECIGRVEHLEEVIMLGMRLRQGLGLDDLQAAAGGLVNARVIRSLEAQGLIHLRGERLVATVRGRLLNDAVIEDLLAACSG